jgi:hypothetical protein
MKISSKVALVISLSLLIAINTKSHATSTIGLSAGPKTAATTGKSYAGAEASLDLSPDSGPGIGARYAYQNQENTMVDFGLSLGSGERDVNILLGATYEFFPDFGKQPALSLKGFYEISRMEKENYNILGVAPILTKGVQAYQLEVYPFVSLPIRYIVGDKNSKGGRLSHAFTLGTLIPMKEQFHGLTLNFEAQFNLKRSFTGFVVGLSKDF